jgi:hypothetical protein
MQGGDATVPRTQRGSQTAHKFEFERNGLLPEEFSAIKLVNVIS